MNRTEKQEFVADLHKRLQRARGTFIVQYQGLNVETMSRLRTELKKVNAEFQVVKNRLLKRASHETDTGLMSDFMKGPSALALTYDDVVSPAKVIVDFQKNVQKLQIIVGQISGRVLDKDGIRRLAELPGRDVLLSQVLSAMQGVPASFVRVVSGVMGKFLNVLKAIEQQKGI